MDHADVRELLELAAAEPGGIDRLIAGDTQEAAAIAGHLAGCSSCTAEFIRLRRASTAIREVVRATAPPELRARTLAFVAAVGRPRGPSAASTVPTNASAAEVGRPRMSRRLAGAAGLAAALLAAIGGTAFVVGSSRDDELRMQGRTVEALVEVTTASLRIAGEPDAERVALTSPDGGPGSGSLVYSPRTGELLVVTTGLAEPAPDREYRCWQERQGERSRVGKMFFGGGLGYWVGPVDDLEADSSFGISLVDLTTGTTVGSPALVGEG